MGMTNFSAGFALISVPYIWLLVRDIFSNFKTFKTTDYFNHLSILQKYIENYLPPLLLGLCGLVGALVLFVIDDRTAEILAAERRPRKHSQHQLGK